MKNKIILLLVLLIAAVILVSGKWSPIVKSRQTVDTNILLPWRIEHVANGSTAVLGITLGLSTLAEAEKIFSSDSEISLFVNPDGKLAIESYFDNVRLANLDARVIAVIDLPIDQLQEIYNRGTRISTLGDGARKVSLDADDMRFVRSQPVASMTYIPKIQLNTAQIEHRFGKADTQIQESGQNITHWLYPEQGLDIALSAVGPTVFQYVPPQHFQRLLEPLTHGKKILPTPTIRP